MQTTNKLLDDLARVASGALGVAAGMRDEVESAMRQRFARVLGDMDLVTREEFDAVKAMAAKARSEEEALKLRIAKLEEQVAQLLVGTSADGTPLTERMPPAD
jgi:BMFP domain-containing protein YqiC